MSRSEGIGKRQKEILEVIKKSILERGFPPSVREICDAVNLKSTSSVHAHLETLERYGYIRRDPTKSRTIEIVDNDFAVGRQEMTSLPVIGDVAAGTPILAEQNITGYFPLPTEVLPKGLGAEEAYILKVHGDSMINAGIFDGDRIFVRSTSDAKNGDIVVAMVDDSATVKTFYKENGHIRLQPENDDMEPIIVSNCVILGKVFGVLRLF